MQFTLAVKVANSISEQGCSLDELVSSVKDLFHTEGLPGFMVLLLRLIDENINVGLHQGNPHCQSHVRPCCGQARLESKGMRSRTIRTSLGLLEFNCRHLRCENCQKTQAPLHTFLKLKSHQRKTVELEQIVSEVISDQSYRRTERHLQVVGKLEIPKSTIHNWIQVTPCDKVAEQLEFDFAQILPDGTGFKKRPKEPGGSNRGELKVMVGIDDQGDMIPMGVWSDKSWADIGASILDPEEASKREHPIADCLVVDGEPGMVEGLEHLGLTVQRCHWHLARDLGFTMWKDQAPLGERKIEAKKLNQLIAIELPEETIDEVSKEDQEKLLE